MTTKELRRRIELKKQLIELTKRDIEDLEAILSQQILPGAVAEAGVGVRHELCFEGGK